MRQYLSALIFFLAFGLSISLNAQDFTADKSAIIKEKIDGKYELLKAKSGGLEIIFHNDRIEIFERFANGREENSFLFFNGATKVMPTPSGLIKEGKVKITNVAMAEVLEASEMEIATYESIIYKDLYAGADLHITLNAGVLDFKLVTEQKKLVPFSISSWDTANIIQGQDHLAMQRHDNVKIYSKQNEFDLKEGKLSFVDVNKNSTNNISFQIQLN